MLFLCILCDDLVIMTPNLVGHSWLWQQKMEKIHKQGPGPPILGDGAMAAHGYTNCAYAVRYCVFIRIMLAFLTHYASIIFSPQIIPKIMLV